MNKAGLVEAVAEKCAISKKDASKMVEAFFATVTETLAQGDKVQLVGFGTFETRERQARTGRNPQTGEPLKMPAARVPAFRVGQSFKNAVR